MAWNGVNVSILAHKWSKNGAEWRFDGDGDGDAAMAQNVAERSDNGLAWHRMARNEAVMAGNGAECRVEFGE